MSHPLRSIEDLVDAPYNPRTISDHALEGLKESLASFGDISGIVFNARTGTLVCGHQRLRALRQEYGDDLKLLTQESSRYGQACLLLEGDDNPTSTFPIRVVDWPLEKERAANLAANHPGLQGQFDDGLLEVIGASKVADPDLFERLHLAELYDFLPPAVPEEGATDPDDVPEAPEEPVVQPGDLWICGEHRVLCGDARKEDVEADILWTDPPYGIGYRDLKEKHDPIDGDDATAARLLETVLRRTKCEAAFIACQWQSFSSLSMSVESAGYPIKAVIVWDKRRGVQNLDRFYKRHEWLIYSGPFGGEPTMDGDVWGIDREVRHDHPTAKPVEIVLRSIIACRGARIYDPFLGSGGTLIAASRLGRRCYGIEIEPRYVQVAIQRWADFTKGDPVRERDGKRLSELLEERKEAR